MEAIILMMTMVIMLIFFMVIVVIIYATGYRKVPPDQAMIIFGRGTGPGEGMSIIKGGGKFIIPIIQSCEFIPLKVRSTDYNFDNIPPRGASFGKNLEVSGTIQYRIGDGEKMLKKASSTILHKDDNERDRIASESVERSLRSEFSGLEREAIMRHKEGLSEKIRKDAKRFASDYGLIIESLTIKEIRAKGDTGELIDRDGLRIVVQCPACNSIFDVEEG